MIALHVLSNTGRKLINLDNVDSITYDKPTLLFWSRGFSEQFRLVSADTTEGDLWKLIERSFAALHEPRNANVIHSITLDLRGLEPEPEPAKELPF